MLDQADAQGGGEPADLRHLTEPAAHDPGVEVDHRPEAEGAGDHRRFDELHSGAAVGDPELPDDLLQALLGHDVAELGAALSNDLQPAALALRPELAAVLEQGRLETDEAARKQIYDDVATQVADDASYIYLYNPDVVQAWSPELEGYTVMSNRAIRFKDVSLSD